MSSKCKIWDFEKVANDLYFSQDKRPLVIKVDDSFLEDISFSLISKKVNSFSRVDGAKLSRDFFEENFQTLDLFSEKKAYAVRAAEKMPKESWIYLEENFFSLDNNDLIFFFSGKDKLFNDLKKKLSAFSFLTINGPMFWEDRDLFNFLSSHFRLRFEPAAMKKILDLTGGESSSLQEIFSILSIYEDKLISEKMVTEFLECTHLDRFALASQFSNKDFGKFYSKLLEFSDDYTNLQGFFSFMQGHLNKMLDPSYVDKKKKLSRYDQDIVRFSRGWHQDGLIRGIEHFSELEILAKRKDDFLKEKLRLVITKGLS